MMSCLIYILELLYFFSLYFHCLYVYLFRVRETYETNWFTFGSPRCFKNEPVLKMFVSLYDEKMYPLHTRNKVKRKYRPYFLEYPPGIK